MKFSVTALLAAAASAQAWNVSYTTEVVTALTTYCPYATTIPVNGVTYTVTEATTLTITNCPCTLTKPVTTYSAPPPPSNSTVVVAKPTTTAAAAVTKSALPTAGAEKAVALSGAGLAGVLALAAFAL